MPQDPKAKEVPMAGGKTSSSEIAGIHRIPTEAIVRLAKRFDVGVERKGEDKAWNALSQNQDVLQDRDFIFHRISHIILHCLVLRDKLVRGLSLDDDDDAGAIIWGGAFLCCVVAAQPRKKCSACGGVGEVTSMEITLPCPACRGTGLSRL